MRLDDPRATILNQPEIGGPGTVALLAADAARYSAFWGCALALPGMIPANSAVSTYLGSDTSGARNQAVEDLLETDRGTWLCFLDDDHTFEADVIARLLARNVDVVQALVLRRQSPFLSVATGLDGNFLKVTGHEPGELVEVLVCGSSGALIRRKVFEAIEPPWFELGYDDDGRRVSEDVNFFLKARKAGFASHVDFGTTLGHLTTAAVYPRWDDNLEKWMTGFVIADGAMVAIQTVDPEPLEEPDADAAAE